jgi:hypothetical protein
LVDIRKEILYPQIQGVTAISSANHYGVADEIAAQEAS